MAAVTAGLERHPYRRKSVRTARLYAQSRVYTMHAAALEGHWKGMGEEGRLRQAEARFGSRNLQHGIATGRTPAMKRSTAGRLAMSMLQCRPYELSQILGRRKGGLLRAVVYRLKLRVIILVFQGLACV